MAAGGEGEKALSDDGAGDEGVSAEYVSHGGAFDGGELESVSD